MYENVQTPSHRHTFDLGWHPPISMADAEPHHLVTALRQLEALREELEQRAPSRAARAAQYERAAAIAHWAATIAAAFRAELEPREAKKP